MKRCLGCMETYDEELDICPHCGYMEGTMPEEAIHVIPGSVLKNRYIIGKVVGYGGFGVTYIAWDTLLQHRVAIKEYLPSEFSTRIPGKTELTVFNGDKTQQFQDGMKKFLDEARRLAKFQNESGIVKIYDCFEDNKTAYIIMEYLEGITLAEYLKENGTIPEDVAVQMLMPIMNSLKAVHKEGIIHRDIAPDNIMITSNGEIKLIDFGAARYATTSHSRSLTVIIKPGYSPEEQYRSRGDQGPHTDVHALGAVLYRMITGQVPPDAMERRAYFENGNKDILEPINKYVKNISTNKENAILNAMNVRIEDRSPDMDTLIHELTTDEPVARVCGKIKKIDILKWPLWLKITVPTALVAIITLTVLFITGVIGFDIHSPREIWIPDGMTRVPRVVSMNEEEAVTLLSEKQLSYVVVGMRYDEQIGEGCILTQGSSVGSVVPVNSALDVVISAGIETMEVPYITGFTQEHAIEELTSQSFTYEIVESYDSVIEKGCIVSQSVAGGSELDKGTMLTLVVSKGRDPEISYTFEGEEMPDINGMLLDDVKAVCEDYGIKLVVTEYEYSNEYDGMCVITQGIDAGSYIQSDIVVEIVLSKGAIIYKVPSLLYLTEEEAKEKLDAKELKYNITYEENENVAAGCVVSQSVAAGTVIEPDMAIDVVVSSGPPKFDMINVVGKMEGDAITALQEVGLIVTSDYVFDDTVAEGTVLIQSIEAGEPVSKRTEIVITVAAKTDLITVPDVTNKEYEKVKSELEALGFDVEKNEIYSTEVVAGNVIAQTPQAGSKQKADTKILLTVSLGKDPVNVTFDANGGTVSESTKVVYYTDAYGSLPIATKDNHVFLGWYTSANAGSKVDESTIVSTNNDQILYAHWERILVDVTFDANGGECGLTNAYMGLGENYELPNVSREFYTFNGWYTAKTGGTKVISDTQITNSYEHTLYAQWTIKTTTVTYDAGSGKVDGNSSVTYDLGTAYGEVKATRAGYVFIGWYTKENGAGDKVLPSTIVTNESAHTLYAYWSNDAYTVSFDSNGGSSCEKVPVVYDEAYGTLHTPERQYYSFDGWYTAKTGGTKIDENSTVSTSGDHTLYARWTRKTVNVFCDWGTGETSSITYELGVKYSTLTPTPSKTGYTFKGWYFDKKYTNTVGASIVENEEGHSIYAKQEANSYKVSFNANGGTSSTTEKNVVYDSTYGTLPEPTRNGYTFNGWYTDKTGGTQVKSTSKVSITAAQTLYAHWTANSYTVSFNANGGSVDTSSKDVTYDGTYGTLPTPTKAGYHFEGWYTAVSGGTEITSSSKVKITSKQTLYARWTEADYTVAFSVNGGKESLTPIGVTYGGIYGNLPTPTRDGYTFDGWYTASTGGSKITSSSKVTITANQTLYAHWTLTEYKINWNTGTGYTISVVKTTSPNMGQTTGTIYSGNTIYYGDILKVTYTEKTGYTITKKGLTSITVTGNVTTSDIYATATANTYKVTFNANGGSVDTASKSVTYGGTYGTLPTPKRTYYSFDGWYTATTGGTKVTSTSNVAITANQTLYARWTENKWSDVVTSLPSNVNSTTYEIKSITQYRYNDYILGEGASIPSGYTKYDEYIKYGDWVTGDWTTDVLTCDDVTRKLVSSEEYVVSQGYTKRRMFAWKYFNSSDNNWWYTYNNSYGGDYREYIHHEYNGNFRQTFDIAVDVSEGSPRVYEFCADQNMYRCNDPNSEYYGDYFFIGKDMEWVPEVKGMRYKYSTRTATTMYKYRKLGTWSSWSTTQYTASTTRAVETRTVYQYRKY